MKKKSWFFLSLFLCIGFLPLSAEDTVETGGEFVLQISTNVEAKLGYTQYFRFPFLQGENPLTEGNNINLALTAEATPISINGLVTAVWTPIAFLEFSVGGRIGSGWTIEISGSRIYGIGLNRPAANGKAEHSGNAFDGMLWKTLAGGAFQFDLAALVPGDWNHFVFRTYHEINYGGYTRAKEGESWYFENGFGEYTNGFIYYSNYILGYQMPITMNMAGIMAEAELYLYDIQNKSQWGDDKFKWTIAAVANFALHERLNIMVAAQFRTMRNYKESDWEDLYYRNRTIDSSSPIRLEFYRIAAIVSYSLK
jgi:hypothetical protein